MKTLIALGATNILLGFTSFALSKHVVRSTAAFNIQTNVNDKRITRYPIENHHTTIAPQKELATPVKIKKKTPVPRIKIKTPVLLPAVVDSLQEETGLDDYNYMQLMDKAEKLQAYAIEHGYSTEYGFLVNMGMKSGKKRFFVVNLSSLVLMERGIMAGSKCTSTGMYKIDCTDSSYKMIGVQPGNSSTCKNGMVLQAMNTIPEEEVDYAVVQSKGCPTLSPAVFNEVSTIIYKNEKPVLMWIFDTEKESEMVNGN
ncbi:hypothetical protein A4D02_31135 [Niastella koreensis]|uniref:Uncharacterized protein n=2 Tax=Niastella koreensis TaxID=354356 RepID=G8T7M7_NIAKG|nr:murein L,D-transpeptidase catalytic domain family protein [Niastella koreensis]AEW02282.1 hypothetical protein Niako_6057 [Niastella koreensis GR20-10]OQP46492.1 hypothetical protein A4D02_31135 [Niastella koreensis]